MIKFRREKDYDYICMALDIVNRYNRRPQGLDPLTVKDFIVELALVESARIIKMAKDQIAEMVKQQETEVKQQTEDNKKDATNDNIEGAGGEEQTSGSTNTKEAEGPEGIVGISEEELKRLAKSR